MIAKSYQELRPTFKTGDIVLFSGNGLISKGIRLITDSPFSHVGMIIVSDELETVFIWESTSISNVEDVIRGEKVQGVQLALLSDRVNAYDGSVYVRPLLGDELTTGDLTELTALRKELRGRPYENNNLELVASAIDIFNNDDGKEDLSSLFCSEAVAEAYQRLGVLPSSTHCKPSNEYTPADFSAKEGLELLWGFYLGDEVHILKAEKS